MVKQKQVNCKYVDVRRVYAKTFGEKKINTFFIVPCLNPDILGHAKEF